MQVVAAAAMEAPAGGDPTTLKDAQRRAVPRDAGGRPGALRARPVRRLPRHRRRRAGLDHRDLRRAAPRHRQLALVGRAVLHPHRQAPAGHPDRAAARLQAPAAAGLPAAAAPAARADQLVVKLDPTTGVRLHRSTPSAPTRPSPSRSTSTWSSPRRAARAPTPVRGAAARRDGRRQHPLHAPGRRRGDAGGSCSRCSTRRRRCTPYAQGIVGPGRGRRAGRRARRLARAVGRRHEHRPVPEGATRQPEPQSAAAPSPFPPIAEYALPVELPHRRAGRARRVDRLAVRPGVRLAERVRQPARPGGGHASGSAPFGINASDGAALRAGHERPDDDLEDADRLAAWSATR